jgi:hypothetical protein
MNVKRTLLLAGLACALLGAPSTASAFKIVKVGGAAITKHTEIHFIADAEFNSAGSGVKCEINGTLTTKDGQEATTSVINPLLITNSCSGFGLYNGCKVSGDTITTPGNVAIDKNAFTFELIVKATFAAGGCNYSHTNFYFEPLTVTVGTGPINLGLLGGKGQAEFEMLKFEVSAAGEFTIGQYTEEGVNKGSAKGVFKIE